jgi:hypothetical protein
VRRTLRSLSVSSLRRYIADRVIGNGNIRIGRAIFYELHQEPNELAMAHPGGIEFRRAQAQATFLIQRLSADPASSALALTLHQELSDTP